MKCLIFSWNFHCSSISKRYIINTENLKPIHLLYKTIEVHTYGISNYRMPAVR